jgi:hypothetical protein
VRDVSFKIQVGFLFSALAISVFYRPPRLAVDRLTQPFLVPPAHLKLFTFGFRENVSDSLWLRLIQDIDHCEHGRKDGLCREDKGWVFHMLDAVTSISPRFRSPYAFGGSVLSVLISDVEGARIIHDRGVEQFPTDWYILYQAAYHYLNEVKEPERAAELLIQAGKNGAPGWVFSLAAKLYTAEGKAFLAKTVIEDMLRKDPDSRFAPRLRQRLQEADAELAKARAGQESSGSP